MSTQMKESQLKKCQEHMVNTVCGLVKSHSEEMMDTINELYEASGTERKANLDVPVVLRVKREADTGYTFSGKIYIRKVERIKDETHPIKYNPELPDLPGLDDDADTDNSADNVGAKESDTKAENPPAEKPEKTGDCKNIFVWPDGKKKEIKA